MIASALTGTLIGVILGVRFTALALVPATICTFIIAGVCAVTGSMDCGESWMQLTVLLICKEVGYLCGAAGSSSVWRKALAPPGRTASRDRSTGNGNIEPRNIW